MHRRADARRLLLGAIDRLDAAHGLGDGAEDELGIPRSGLAQHLEHRRLEVPPLFLRVARLFGVTAPAASEWGRIRPIPRHLRPRIEDYLGLGARTRAERAHEALASHRRVLERIQDLLLVEMPGLDKLPLGYREQYRERVKEIEIRVEANLAEIAARIERELADVRARLIAEYHSEGCKRRICVEPYEISDE